MLRVKILGMLRNQLKSITPGKIFSEFKNRRQFSSAILSKRIGNTKVFSPSNAIILSLVGLSLSLWYLLVPDSKISSDFEPFFSVEEVMKHNTLQDCWISIYGKIYDVSKFLELHPGGASRIFKYAGNDASVAFRQMHSTDVIEKVLDQVKYIGLLDGEFQEEEKTEEELLRLEKIARKPSLSHMFNISDFEHVAKQILPKTTYTYFATGSSDEFSLRENHYAYSRVFFRPRVLQDVGEVDTSSTLLGNEVSVPIYITAFAGSLLAHSLGEFNLMNAAYKEGIIQMVPKILSFSQKEFFNQVPEDQRQWYQLHFDNQEELENMAMYARQLNSLPNIKGIFINVDLADLGNREKDSKIRAEDEISASSLKSCVDNGNVHYPKKLLWSDILRFKSMTDLPIALKGVQRGEDVVMAAENGISGVILSNHGGRQLDFSRPPLEVLVETKRMLKEKGLENQIEIYIDGGIRRGSDIIKALCLGAKGVGLGRPFLYAMSGYGEEGVTRVIQILKHEMKNNMKLLGVGRIEDLNEDLVDIESLKFRNPAINDRLYDSAYQELSSPKFGL